MSIALLLFHSDGLPKSGIEDTVTELKLQKVQNKEQSCRVCSCASTRGDALHPPKKHLSHCNFLLQIFLLYTFPDCAPSKNCFYYPLQI